MSEKPEYFDRMGEPHEKPRSGVTNFMSWRRLARLLDEAECRSSVTNAPARYSQPNPHSGIARTGG